LPSQLFFESSDLDSVQLCLGTVEFDVLLFGQLEELPVERSLLSSLHLSLVLGTALWVLSADVAAKRLGTSEKLIALLALELFLWLSWGFHEIKVILDPRDAVSSLWGSKKRGRGLGCGLRVAAFAIQLQSDLALGVLRIAVGDLVLALFSDGVLRCFVFLFYSLALLFMQIAQS